MKPAIRNPRSSLLALSSLLAALGCTSTSTISPETSRDPIRAEASDPGAVTLHAEEAPSFEPVYFDTDRSHVRPEARAALERYATAILDHPEWGVLTIDGHCDERGSEEYNLALGRHRAAAVRRYLVDLGVPAERLKTRTFGEMKPAMKGHTEAVWRYNRRSELTSQAFDSARR